MFFLLRTAFWLSLVILLIPSDATTGDNDEVNISTLQALGAAQQTYSDMARFCERNEAACATGGAALELFSAKARSGARMIYDYLDPAGTAAPDAISTGAITTGATNAPAPVATSVPASAPAVTTVRTQTITVPGAAVSRAAATAAPAAVGSATIDPAKAGTLTARDRAPAWVPPLPMKKPA